jgi:hypothetical protein
MKPHIRLHYLGPGLWWADVADGARPAQPLMYTRVLPCPRHVGIQCANLWRDWLFITNYA